MILPAYELISVSPRAEQRVKHSETCCSLIRKELNDGTQLSPDLFCLAESGTTCVVKA